MEPPVRSTDKPLRLCIANVYSGLTGNITLEGKVESGSVAAGDKVVAMPNGEMAQVKSKLCQAARIFHLTETGVV